MNDENKRMAAFAIEQMYKSSHFSITAVRDAAKLMSRHPGGGAYDKLHPLHCVHWGDIPEDIMQMIPVWMNEVLGGPRLSVTQIPALFEGNVELPKIEDIRAPLRIK